MKDLLTFLIKNIIGTDDFQITENMDGDHISLDVTTQPESVGLIIGREGKTIKNLRKILSVRAVREGKTVSINIVDTSSKATD